jgi:hypothetical protein
MASLARHIGQHVLTVIEINKVWQIVDFDPCDRTMLLHAFLKPLDLDRLFFEHTVTVHTDAG